MVTTADHATGAALRVDLYNRIGSFEHINVEARAASGNTAQHVAELASAKLESATAVTNLNHAELARQGALEVRDRARGAIQRGDVAIYDKDNIFNHILASAKRTCKTALHNVMADYSGKKAKTIESTDDIRGEAITLRHHGFRDGTEVTLSNIGLTGLAEGKVYTVKGTGDPHMFQLLDPDDYLPKGTDDQPATDMVVNYTRRTAVEEFVHTMNDATPAQVNSVVFSADGEYALTSYDDSPICVRWSTPAAGAREAIGLYLHSTSSNVISVASADSSGAPTFAVAGADGTVDIIDSESGTNRLSIKAFVAANDDSTATSMCCSNDGAWIAVGDNQGHVTVISPDAAATGAATAPAAIAAAAAANADATAARRSAAASPADAAAAAAADAALAIANAAADAADAAAGIILEEEHPERSGDPITSVAFRQDGMLVACQEHHIALWLAWQDRRDQVVGISDNDSQDVNSVCFSGDYLVYGREDGAIISFTVADVVSGMEEKLDTFEQRKEDLTNAQQQLQDAESTASNYDTVIAAAAATAGVTPIEFAAQAITTGLNLVIAAVRAGDTSPLAAKGDDPEDTEVADAATVAADAVAAAAAIEALATDVSDVLKENWSVHHIMRLVYNDVVYKLVQGPVALAGVQMQAALEAKATAEMLVDRYQSQYDAEIARDTAEMAIPEYMANLDFTAREERRAATGDAILSVSALENADFIVYGGAAGVGVIGMGPGGTDNAIDATLICKATAVHPIDQIIVYGTSDQALGYKKASEASETYGLAEMFEQIVKPDMERLQSRVTPAALPPYTITGPVATFTNLAEWVISGIDDANAQSVATLKFDRANHLFTSILGTFVAIFDDVRPLDYLARRSGSDAAELLELKQMYQAPLTTDPFAHLGTFKLLEVSDVGFCTYTNTLTQEELSYIPGQKWVIKTRDGRTVWEWENPVQELPADGTNGAKPWKNAITNEIVDTIVFGTVEMYTDDVHRFLVRYPRVASEPAELREAVATAGRLTSTQDTKIAALRTKMFETIRRNLEVLTQKKLLTRQIERARARVIRAGAARDRATDTKIRMEAKLGVAQGAKEVAEQLALDAQAATGTAVGWRDEAYRARDTAVAETDEANQLRARQEMITRMMLGVMRMADNGGDDVSDDLVFNGVYNGKPVFTDTNSLSLVFANGHWVLLRVERGATVDDALAAGNTITCRARAAEGDAEWFPMACDNWQGPSPVSVPGLSAVAMTVAGATFTLRHVRGGPAKWVHERTMEENDALIARIRALSRDIDRLTGELGDSGAEKAAIQRECATLRAEVGGHALKIDRLVREHGAEQAELKAKYAVGEKRITLLEMELVTARAAEAAANALTGGAGVAAIAATMAPLQAQIDKVNEDLAAKGRDLGKVSDELAEKGRDLENVTEELDDKESELEKVTEELVDMESQRDKKADELADTQTQRDRAQEELSTAMTEHGSIKSRLEAQVEALKIQVAQFAAGGGGAPSTPYRGGAAASRHSLSAAASPSFGTPRQTESPSPLRRAHDRISTSSGDEAAAAAEDIFWSEILKRRAERVGDLALVSPGYTGTGADNLGTFKLSGQRDGYPMYMRLDGTSPAAVPIAGGAAAAMAGSAPSSATYLFKNDKYWYVAELPQSEEGDDTKFQAPWNSDDPRAPGWWRVEDADAKIPIEITNGPWQVYDGGGTFSDSGWIEVDGDTGAGGAWWTRIVVEAAINTVQHRGSSMNDVSAHDILVDLKAQDVAIDSNPFRPARFYETVNAFYNLKTDTQLRYLAERLGIKVVSGGFGPTGESKKPGEKEGAWIRRCLLPYVGLTSRIPYLPKAEIAVRTQPKEGRNYRALLADDAKGDKKYKGATLPPDDEMNMLEKRVYAQIMIGETRVAPRDTAFDDHAIGLAAKVVGTWTDDLSSPRLKGTLVFGQGLINDQRAKEQQEQFTEMQDERSVPVLPFPTGGGGGGTPGPRVPVGAGDEEGKTGGGV